MVITLFCGDYMVYYITKVYGYDIILLVGGIIMLGFTIVAALLMGFTVSAALFFHYVCRLVVSNT